MLDSKTHFKQFPKWIKLYLTFVLLTRGVDSLDRKEYAATFLEDSDVLCKFQHLEYDSGSDKLYVGAVNYIHQLDADVRLEKSAKTGPEPDNGRCYPHYPCPLPTVMTPNYNKLLKIDYDNKRILACGSVRQGICDLRQLGNVTHLLNEFSDRSNDPRGNDFVASTKLDQSTVAFIANEGDGGREKSLYVGTSRTVDDSELAADDDQFMTFASRRMPKNNMDSLMLSTDLDGTAVGLMTKKEWSSKGFRVNYISAFEGNQNGYFVLKYPEFEMGTVSGEKVNSYVAQVCLKGRFSPRSTTTSSYFEIPIAALTWLGGREAKLHDVIASTTAKVGNDLGRDLRIKNIPGGKNPDVLFASFATEGKNVGGSVVAMFPLYELDKVYYQMAKSCINGERMNHINWQREKELPCKDILMTVREPLCSNTDIWDVLGLFQSKEPQTGYTIFESNHTIVTSLAVTKLSDHTVVFMGTQDGRLLKLKIDAKPAGRRLPQPYEELQIDSLADSIKWRNMGSPKILPNMRLNNRLNTLYVMSERRLVALPLYDCGKHLTCSDCLRTGDPFCGWCTLDNRCTSADMCAQGQHTYATSEPSNCPRMDDTDPVALSVTDSSQIIKINVKNVPNPEVRGQYSCDFGGRYRSEARLKGDYVTCSTPTPSKMPTLNGQEVSVPLSLYFRKLLSEQGLILIASTEIVFYDCANFKSCQPCLMESGKFRCQWCINDNQCVKAGETCLRTPGDIIEQSRCPQLLSVMEPPHLHVGEKERVRLRAENLPSISSAQGYKCHFFINDRTRRVVNATHMQNTIICDSLKGFLPTGVYEAEATISVYWNKNFLIDNPKKLNVTMYQCSRPEGDGAEDNCGQCLLLSRDLKCGYCEEKKKCTLCAKCPHAQCGNTVRIFRGWLDQSQDCKMPVITQFEPKSAAPGGVTRITIEGRNLGRTYEKLDGGITVAGEQCAVLSDDYKESEKVVCEVRGVSDGHEGPVVLCIQEFGGRGGCRGREYEATSGQNFKFVSPRLDSFEPKEGLYAGGTKIDFKGQNLDIGNGVTVLINDRSCVVTHVTGSSFSCVLSCDASGGNRARRHTHRHHHLFRHSDLSRRSHRSKRSVSGRVKVIFDQKQMYYPDVFLMERNVEVRSLSPRESIMSGGMKLTVKGENLNLAKAMFLQVTAGKITEIRECEPPSPGKSIRHCYTPSIKAFDGGKRNYSAEVVLDACLTLPVGYIEYTGDPYLNLLDATGDVSFHKGGPIIITGRNLCPNPSKCDITSVRVQIGDALQCNVTNLDADKLVCVPPEGAGGKHTVVVYIGDYHQAVGDLQFDNGSPPLVIIIILVAVVIAVVVIAVFCVHRKRDKNSQTVKQLQMQLDMMEAKVAKECKEAFAELQTDMQSDLDNIGSVGIPFRQRYDYIMRVLFPDPDMYEKLNQTMHTPYAVDVNNRLHHNGRGAPHRTGCMALEAFDKLLESRPFLLVFIKTLEAQRKFSMKDKGNVAALLMIVLQNRLQYATDILESLLADLIRNNMESSSHPKLLLRRTESVAEKMLTHWFSILLYGFLMECAGEPLFMLYRAIKAQLDKGPIDAISGEAKYSLSEDKLLRQAISYEQLVLIVIENDGNDQPGQVIQVKVLDCDTISQTKEKIIAVKYRNQPLSQHPDPNDFDLEMDQDPMLRAVLSDEDNTSVIEGGWKRINTLLHYKVKDRTRVAMVPKKIQAFSQSMNSNPLFGPKIGGMRHNGSGQRLINDGAGSLPRYMAQMQGSRSTTPTIIDDGKKLYHLVKHHDAEPKDGGSDLGSKMASEIYLTRLLATKGTIQKFVDDLFETIFSVIQRGHALPLAIKHMFDFLDDQASYYGVTDPGVVHAWKSNCLPLRFWVNLIKNPQFLFDIKKPALVDSCLTVIGQTFMDSCSKSDHVLGKDSPSNKLLYAKDIPNYKQWVEKYYSEISSMEPLNQNDMRCFLEDESRTYRNNLNSQAALTQLYLYVQKYSTEIVDALNNDPAARNQRLAQRLEHVATTMTSTV